jgi:hypothetical protein
MAAPGGETEKRRAIARRAAEQLAARTDLSASLLAGSAARGTCDEPAMHGRLATIHLLKC